jgi:hypothetical protein
MVEAERVDVSLKENDVKNRRSLPIPNHSFPPCLYRKLKL